MIAIYSSKLFKMSSRKDKIRSAISDPVNLELVKQLKSYLDDDEVDKLSETSKDEGSEVDDKSKISKDDDRNSSDNENDVDVNVNLHHPSDHHLSNMLKNDGSSDDFDIPEESESNSENSESNNSKDSIPDESSEVSEAMDINSVDESMMDESSIKDLLNSDETTDGVRRISKKGSELWIYYNDDVNLNNVMEEVISKLVSYNSRLEFNRLARTDNAVVFEVS